jgi:hypothetical protein
MGFFVPGHAQEEASFHPYGLRLMAGEELLVRIFWNNKLSIMPNKASWRSNYLLFGLRN